MRKTPEDTTDPIEKTADFRLTKNYGILKALKEAQLVKQSMIRIDLKTLYVYI